jgi:hypothetical protein
MLYGWSTMFPIRIRKDIFGFVSNFFAENVDQDTGWIRVEL